MFCGRVILFLGVCVFMGFALEHDYVQQLQYAFDNRLEDLCSKSTDANLCKDAGKRCLTGLKPQQGVKDETKTKLKNYFYTCLTSLNLQPTWETYKIANPDTSKNLGFFSTLEKADSVALKCCIGRESGKLDANSHLDKTALIKLVETRVGTSDNTALTGLRSGLDACDLGAECDVRAFLRCALQNCMNSILASKP